MAFIPRWFVTFLLPSMVATIALPPTSFLTNIFVSYASGGTSPSGYNLYGYNENQKNITELYASGTGNSCHRTKIMCQSCSATIVGWGNCVTGPYWCSDGTFISSNGACSITTSTATTNDFYFDHINIPDSQLPLIFFHNPTGNETLWYIKNSTNITVHLFGAGGGGSINSFTGGKGGSGAYVTGVLSVPANVTLRIIVGAGGLTNGQFSQSELQGGGGGGGVLSGQGGGRSSIQQFINGEWIDMVTAGGGGGAGGSCQSNGGTATWTGNSGNGTGPGKFRSECWMFNPSRIGGMGGNAWNGGISGYPSTLSGLDGYIDATGFNYTNAMGTKYRGGSADPMNVGGGGGGGFHGGSAALNAGGGAGSSYTANLAFANGTNTTDSTAPSVDLSSKVPGINNFIHLIAYGGSINNNGGNGLVILDYPRPSMTPLPGTTDVNIACNVNLPEVQASCSASPSVTSTSTATGSNTPTTTVSPTPTGSGTATTSPSPTPTTSGSDTPSPSPTPTLTGTGTTSPSPTPSSTGSGTSSPTGSPTPTTTPSTTSTFSTGASPSSTRTPSTTNTGSGTATKSSTSTGTSSATSSATKSSTSSSTSTATSSSTSTSSRTRSGDPTSSATSSGTTTRSSTVSAISTSTSSSSPSSSESGTSTTTGTPTPSTTPSALPPSASNTPTPTISDSSSNSATPSTSPSNSPTPSVTPSISYSSTNTATGSATGTGSPSATSSGSAIATLSSSPSASASFSAFATFTATNSESAISSTSATSSASASSSASSSSSSSSSATSSASATSTLTPTGTSTPTPTETCTPTNTATPSTTSSDFPTRPIVTIDFEIFSVLLIQSFYIPSTRQAIRLAIALTFGASNPDNVTILLVKEANTLHDQKVIYVASRRLQNAAATVRVAINDDDGIVRASTILRNITELQNKITDNLRSVDSQVFGSCTVTVRELVIPPVVPRYAPVQIITNDSSFLGLAIYLWIIIGAVVGILLIIGLIILCICARRKAFAAAAAALAKEKASKESSRGKLRTMKSFLRNVPSNGARIDIENLTKPGTDEVEEGEQEQEENRIGKKNIQRSLKFPTNDNEDADKNDDSDHENEPNDQDYQKTSLKEVNVEDAEDNDGKNDRNSGKPSSQKLRPTRPQFTVDQNALEEPKLPMDPPRPIERITFDFPVSATTNPYHLMFLGDPDAKTAILSAIQRAEALTNKLNETIAKIVEEMNHRRDNLEKSGVPKSVPLLRLLEAVEKLEETVSSQGMRHAEVAAIRGGEDDKILLELRRSKYIELIADLRRLLNSLEKNKATTITREARMGKKTQFGLTSFAPTTNVASRLHTFTMSSNRFGSSKHHDSSSTSTPTITLPSLSGLNLFGSKDTTATDKSVASTDAYQMEDSREDIMIPIHNPMLVIPSVDRNGASTTNNDSNSNYPDLSAYKPNGATPTKGNGRLVGRGRR